LPCQHFQALNDLLIREFGSFAVFSEVNFFFMPVIRAQNESLRDPPSGCGGFRFIPCFFADARPLAFKPPFSDLPSLRCHAGDLAINETSLFSLLFWKAVLRTDSRLVCQHASREL
jgi:hypothetical protein